MIKIEAITLEKAYEDAATKLECSVTELTIEVVQIPKKGLFGLFKKSAIIVATQEKKSVVVKKEKQKEKITPVKEVSQKEQTSKSQKSKKTVKKEEKKEEHYTTMLNDTIMPASFVSDQDDDDDLGSGLDYTADYDDEFDETEETKQKVDMKAIAKEVEVEMNSLFNLTCFSIDKIDVSVYDNETLLVEFKGEDAALLIGKEGYRYKALSYMIFNWLNSKYEVQLRLEIAEFLKNQEESIGRYLVNVYDNIDRDGRAQTKILDGVLVQIALKELRNKYPNKYVVIRSTKDGLKYIIINDYHGN